ncbi:MAG: BatA domain-containing protein, partial [Planctomycetes bacterium]|nr:BatA domain-containing protein [Planctomycetota bacterium]
VMRQQPKQLVFPAIRFIKQRRDTNRRQLQLRHWLLLLLRCLAIALLAATLARPSVHSLQLGNWILAGVIGFLLLIAALLTGLSLIQRRGALVTGGLLAATVLLAGSEAWIVRSTLADNRQAPIGNERAPVAAVLVFDTSPRMQYLWQNQTRLQQAQETAFWLIRQLPPDSEVAVVDSRPGGAVFSVDLAAAQRSIERLETTGTPLPLPGVLDQAIELAAASRKARREVYVFSDLTESAWTAESPTALQRRLAETEDVLLYIVDVGQDEARNTALGDLRLSGEVLPRSSELTIQGQVSCAGTGGATTVELYLEQADADLPLIRDGQTLVPEPQLRDKQIVELDDDGGQTVRFQLRGLDLGTHQGWLKIAGQDGLAFDDTRYFTVEVQEASPVLVLAPPGVTTKYFTEAVAPYEFRQTGRASYACTVAEQAQLPNLDLDDYAAVCLLDPMPLTPPDWEKLGGYVRRGGGVGIFLGHNAEPAAFNVESAHRVLGGRLARQWRSAGDLFLTLRDLNHPVTSAFRDIATTVPWERFPVHRHWVLEDFSENARLV